ncbi:MAG: BatD family protein [Bacteroidota bacterium]
MQKIDFQNFFNNKSQLHSKLLVVLSLFLLFGLSVSAQVSVKVDTTKIRIGEQIQYELSIEKEGVDEVFFPKLNMDSLKKLEVVRTAEIDSVKNRIFRKYTLTAWDSGRYMLPKQSVLINKKQYFSDSIFIDVATVAVDTTKQKMYPIKDIQKEPYTFDDFKSYLWWLLAILIVLAVILYFVLRKKPTEEEIIARIPPYDLAKQRLKELDDKHLIQQNRIKRYYVELTDIVRTFIERELHIPALESTTGELIETITDFNSSSKLGIPKETIHKLQELLKEADLVKFAKSKPFLNEIDMHRKDAEKIVNDLHPEEKTEEKSEDDQLKKEEKNGQ